MQRIKQFGGFGVNEWDRATVFGRAFIEPLSLVTQEIPWIRRDIIRLCRKKKLHYNKVRKSGYYFGYRTQQSKGCLFVIVFWLGIVSEWFLLRLF